MLPCAPSGMPPCSTTSWQPVRPPRPPGYRRSSSNRPRCPREIPHTVAEAQRLASDLRDRTAVPIRWVLDVGHALYRPLYGEDVDLIDWLDPLRDDIALLHLQNHDFQSDAHWGWPDDRGLYDVAAFAQTVRNAGLDRRSRRHRALLPLRTARRRCPRQHPRHRAPLPGGAGAQCSLAFASPCTQGEGG